MRSCLQGAAKSDALRPWIPAVEVPLQACLAVEGFCLILPQVTLALLTLSTCVAAASTSVEDMGVYESRGPLNSPPKSRIPLS